MSKKLQNKILDLLDSEPCTLKELANELGESDKTIFKVLRKLFTKGEVNSYSLNGKRVYFKGDFRALDKKKVKHIEVKE